MRFLWTLGLAVAFTGLLWARYDTSESWRYGLLTIGLGLAFAATVGAATLFKKLVDAPLWKSASAACVGVFAAGARLCLWAWDRSIPGGGPPALAMWKILAISVQIVGASVALILGCLALWTLAARRTPGDPDPDPPPSDRRRILHLVLTCTGLTTALYGLAPVTLALGVPLSHWTFVVLVALSAVIFALTGLAQRLSRSRRPEKQDPSPEDGTG